MRSVLLIACAVLASCSPQGLLTRKLADTEKKFKDQTGFMLYDPATKKTLVAYRAGQYFIPASNTKIVTLFTALQLLGDSVPALKYVVKNDSLLCWGTGDPSFLYPRTFDNGRLYGFLKNSTQKLFISSNHFQAEQFGPGWAWDDYNFSYSAERSPFPIYGNLISLKKSTDRFTIAPLLLANHFIVGDSVAGESSVVREVDSNELTFFPGKKKNTRSSWEIPFHYSSDLLVELLSDTLKKEVGETNLKVPPDAKVLYSIPADSLYAVMMKMSDNFIAEQLLLMCAGQVSDTLKPEIAIRYAKKNFFSDLADELVWVDGSGLSRYNLFTPQSVVGVWEKIYGKVPQERLFKLLAVGGQKGTLRNFSPTDPPFVFGKSGSLSNNQTLSGFVVTKKGKVLIFSFMNGNYVVPSRDVRNMMQDVLTKIHDSY